MIDIKQLIFNYGEACTHQDTYRMAATRYALEQAVLVKNEISLWQYRYKIISAWTNWINHEGANPPCIPYGVDPRYFEIRAFYAVPPETLPKPEGYMTAGEFRRYISGQSNSFTLRQKSESSDVPFYGNGWFETLEQNNNRLDNEK